MGFKLKNNPETSAFALRLGWSGMLLGFASSFFGAVFAFAILLGFVAVGFLGGAVGFLRAVGLIGRLGTVGFRALTISGRLLGVQAKGGEGKQGNTTGTQAE